MISATVVPPGGGLSPVGAPAVESINSPLASKIPTKTPGGVVVSPSWMPTWPWFSLAVRAVSSR